nr:MAG TPA: hypothetical protein [Caudoviricetes sp.]
MLHMFNRDFYSLVILLLCILAYWIIILSL